MTTEPIAMTAPYGSPPPAPTSAAEKPRLTQRRWFWPVVAGVSGLVVGSMAAGGSSADPTASQITGSTQYTELEEQLTATQGDLEKAEQDAAAAKSAAEDAEADVVERDAEIKALKDSVAAEAPAAPPAEAPGAPPAEPETFSMPALVGVNLQLAQDQLQSLGSYVLDQTDASGLGRAQVLDSNWQVCAQQPAPGSVVPIDTMVTLSAVKLSETCP